MADFFRKNLIEITISVIISFVLTLVILSGLKLVCPHSSISCSLMSFAFLLVPIVLFLATFGIAMLTSALVRRIR